MSTFLQRVAADIFHRQGEHLADCVFIFPNKRPIFTFRKDLAAAAGKLFLSIDAYSLEDFVAEKTGLSYIDNLQAVFLLYEIYRKHVSEEEFDEFYQWGNMLLRDYDECDRNLVDAEMLFNSIRDIKEMEARFEPEVDETEGIENQLLTGKPGEKHFLKKRFLKLWRIVSEVYAEFRQSLSGQNLAYPGIAYREFYNQVVEQRFDPKGKIYVFIGFNALSKAEERLMRDLVLAGHGVVYWDADKYYLENDREEAGYFIRRHLARVPSDTDHIFTDNLRTQAIKINLVGIPLQVGQAKALGSELNQYFTNAKNSSSAIVLPDENLLIPILHSLPENVPGIQVNPGYPLRNSSLYRLVEHLISLNDERSKNGGGFYYKNALAVLGHPYFSSCDPEGIKRLREIIEAGNIIYLSQGIISEQSQCVPVGLVFRPVESAFGLLHYLEEVLDYIGQNAEPAVKEEPRIFEELKAILARLKTNLFSGDITVGRNTFVRLFRESVNNTAIPFEHKPDASLQIMGMLETRCLNFDTVFMLSVNEGTLPANKRQGSFIPYDVRKAFGLPTMDEQDALYAYTLFRLISGAKEVYLFYNSETGSKGEEKSRYIRQIEQYLAAENPKIRIEYRNYSLPLRSNPAKTINIAKDDAYYNILREKAQTDQKGISPSFISSYFGCSLQFLLNYVYKLRPKEEITEDLEAADFGTLFHDTMQALYERDLNCILTAKDIQDKLADIDEALNKALKKLHRGQATYIYSRNSLQMETIKLLVKRTLEHDMAYAPFRVISLEKEIRQKLVLNHPEMQELWLQGKVDRVDEKDDTIRIVDYKTGHVKRYEFDFTNEEETLTTFNKEAFQTLFYTYLYASQAPNARLQPYILPLKDVNNGYRRVNEPDQSYTLADLKPYEEKLKEILNTILDRDRDIVQVEDHSICSYCDYNTLCLR